MCCPFCLVRTVPLHKRKHIRRGSAWCRFLPSLKACPDRGQVGGRIFLWVAPGSWSDGKSCCGRGVPFPLGEYLSRRDKEGGGFCYLFCVVHTVCGDCAPLAHTDV